MTKYFVVRDDRSYHPQGTIYKTVSGYANGGKDWKSEEDAFFIEAYATGHLNNMTKLAQKLNGEDNAK